MSIQRMLLLIVVWSCFLVVFVLTVRAEAAQPPKPVTRMLSLVGQIERPCPASALVVGVLGQSNSANHTGGPLSSRPELPAYMFLNGHCYELQDPVLGATTDVRSYETRGSVMTRLGLRLAAALGRPVVIIAGGVGGYRAADWMADAYGARTWYFSQVEQASSKGLHVDHYVWLQGESDTLARTRRSSYAASVRHLFALLKQLSPGARFWMARQSRCLGQVSSDVRNGQTDVSKQRKDVTIFADLDRLNGRKWRRDGCHFTAKGAGWIAQALERALVEAEN